MPESHDQTQDARTLAQAVNKELRESQRRMFSGKLEEAQAHLNTAAELLEQIRAVDPGFAQLKILEGKVAKQQKDLDRRKPKTALETAVAAPPADKPSEVAEPARLPGSVAHRLRQIDRTLQNADRILTRTGVSDEWKAKELERILGQANSVMDEIQTSYGDQIPPDHPEITAAQNNLAELQSKLVEFKEKAAEQKAREAQVEEQREALSREWLARIQPYMTGPSGLGYDEAKYFIAAAAEDVAELRRRMEIYDEVAALFAEYKEVEFPAGKTDELERAEKDLSYALDTFSTEYESTVERFIARAKEATEGAVEWLDGEEAKDDGKRQPMLLHKDIVPNITKLIATAAAAVSEGDPRVTDLQGELAGIEQRAGRLRELRTERTFMTPDQFEGEELEEIKAKAADIWREKHPAESLLRITVINEDWKEESVLEHTDTTMTAVRHRVTRSLTAQIAGKREADVFLYTMHIARDKRTDGSWGPYYGHVMFTDPMPEENVEKG